ncbi:hypothetical protein EMIT053CA3_60101 [Pseudomonas donghuensis]
MIGETQRGTSIPLSAIARQLLEIKHVVAFIGAAVSAWSGISTHDHHTVCYTDRRRGFVHYH